MYILIREKFCAARRLASITAALLAFGTVFAAGRGAQELVLAGSPVYDKACAVFLESGIWNFADSVPVTIEELKFHLGEVDYGSLSEAGKASYNGITAYFEAQNYSFDSDLLSIGFAPSINLEGYCKTNDDVPWYFDRYDRKPLVDLPMSISCGDYASIVSDFFLSQNIDFMERGDTHFNVPAAQDQFTTAFPTTAYFSTGKMLSEGTGVSFQLGMAERAVGRTLSGSIIMSEYMTGVTYGQLSLFSRNIKFTSSVAQLNVDRYFYTHKIEIRPTKKLTLSAMEGQLAAHSMELRFLNPLPVFHAFAPWRDYSEEDDMYTCAYLALKAVYVPVKYLRLYGMFAMTQYQTPYETSNWGDSLTPNGLGGQAGLEAYVPAGSGYFHGGLEFYYAQPYLYLKPSPNSSMVRTYKEDIGDMDNIYEWIGSPFGPDSIALTAKAGYEKPDSWAVSLKYLLLIQGELADKKIFGKWGGTDLFMDADGEKNFVENGWGGYPRTTAERDQSTPTGTPQYANRVSLRLSCFPAERIELVAQPSFAAIFNNAHVEGQSEFCFEAALGCRIRL